MRLNRFLAQAGFGARRKVESLIIQGRVSVNGRAVTELATEVDPARDRVEVDGKIAQAEVRSYIILNKPPGVLTSVSDDRARPTVLDLVDVKRRVFPVGRLDKDTRGLILLTNDGELMERLIHPRHRVKKVYVVEVVGGLSGAQLQRFRDGIVIGGRVTHKAEIRLVRRRKTSAVYEVGMREGRKRQVRRMFKSLGCSVTDLVRTKIGPLSLGTLREGSWRHLTEEEVCELKSL